MQKKKKIENKQNRVASVPWKAVHQMDILLVESVREFVAKRNRPPTQSWFYYLQN